MSQHDVVVVGSGVIGLSCAWRIAATGRSVALVDEHPGRGASYVAAGMLAPVTEAAYGEEALCALNVQAGSLWPEFAEQLEHKAGEAIGYERSGTLLVGADEADRSYLKELLAFHQQMGLGSTWISPSACREIEPLLSPAVRGGLWSSIDHQVDNRRLLAGLARAVRQSKVHELSARAELDFAPDGSVRGIWADGEQLGAQTVLLAAGHRSASLLPEALRHEVPLRPVKGQILRLFLEDPALRPTVTLRALVEGRSLYLVPRSSGQLVIGATSEEAGEDLSTTAGAAYSMLRDALRVLPSLGEAVFDELSAGLRPATPDNMPIVGPSSRHGLLIATGHYRHGILYSPLTCAAILSVLDEGNLPEWATALSPLRFSR